MYHEDFVATSWQLLLIFYAICLITFVICAFGNRFLPMVDTICVSIGFYELSRGAFTYNITHSTSRVNKLTSKLQ